jgi:hypothetical protein
VLTAGSRFSAHEIVALIGVGRTCRAVLAKQPSPLNRADSRSATIRFTRLTPPPLQRRSGHPERTSRLVDRHTGDTLNTFSRHDGPRSTEPRALRPRSLRGGAHPHSDTFALELCDRGEDHVARVDPRSMRSARALARGDLGIVRGGTPDGMGPVRS